MKLFSEKLNFAISITFNKKKVPPPLGLIQKAPPTKEGFAVIVTNKGDPAASSRSTAPVNSSDRTALLKAQKRDHLQISVERNVNEGIYALHKSPGKHTASSREFSF